ncbi:excinuclease ABC subunit UvrA, partial [Brachyspira pilosicoli]
VITGVSGSGKTSLAFDTIFKEGQRRFVESLSTYARRFLGRFEDANVEKIEGLAPAIAIDQKNVSRNPRSTVATVTEIYDYFRLIFARLAKPHCPHCSDKDTLKAETPSILATEIVDTMEQNKLVIISPLYHSSFNHRFTFNDNDAKDIKKIIEKTREAGYVRMQINNNDYVIDDITEEDIKELSKEEIYSVGIVIDRVVVGKDKRARIADALEKAMDLSNGVAHIKA